MVLRRPWARGGAHRAPVCRQSGGSFPRYGSARRSLPLPFFALRPLPVFPSGQQPLYLTEVSGASSTKLSGVKLDAHHASGASLVALAVKNQPAVQETGVQSRSQEDPLEKEMATHSNILAWEIPRAEEPGRLQSLGSQESDMP